MPSSTWRVTSARRTTIAAVGVAAAGFIDRDRATVIHAPNIAWRNEPLKAILEARIDVPVTIENDANAAGWAEFRFGAGRDVDDMVMLTMGTGVGGAVDRRAARCTAAATASPASSATSASPATGCRAAAGRTDASSSMRPVARCSARRTRSRTPAGIGDALAAAPRREGLDQRARPSRGSCSPATPARSRRCAAWPPRSARRAAASRPCSTPSCS